VLDTVGPGGYVACKNHPLVCVGWDAKPYSLTQCITPVVVGQQHCTLTSDDNINIAICRRVFSEHHLTVNSLP